MDLLVAGAVGATLFSSSPDDDCEEMDSPEVREHARLRSIALRHDLEKRGICPNCGQKPSRMDRRCDKCPPTRAEIEASKKHAMEQHIMHCLENGECPFHGSKLEDGKCPVCVRLCTFWQRAACIHTIVCIIFILVSLILTWFYIPPPSSAWEVY